MKRKKPNQEEPQEMDLAGQSITVIDGSVACGWMREMFAANRHDMDLSSFYGASTPRTLSITARGDSMIDAGICDGDQLVIDPCVVPQEGSIVVARVGYEFTVKYLSIDEANQCVTLYPANIDYEPIVVKDLENFDVVGVVTSINRPLPHLSSEQLQRLVDSRKGEGRISELISRTIAAGYMKPDGYWAEKATNEFRAAWIDRVCTELNIADKWSWATARWHIPNLKRYLPRTKETGRGDIITEKIDKIFN